ncbi:MAG: deoxyribose-phosphate aldolase [Altibacter sp.]|uniref:deoxyribose-phosphate aldolase n=1 Tax=Altibacter sp. TaxID=2024823 RepID=UPI001D400845|nr:deoxyribose-phosphate aldolase [Altibacter sp.]MBZ0327971.1 deoxyribose-phosphate aldolase [Altibacter sp.]
MELNKYIDHTLLKPTATPDDIVQLCDEAKKYKFHSVCVNSCYVFLASNELLNTDIKVVSTIGFPLGTASTKAKRSETKRAIKEGAHEIDMVMNIGFLKHNLFKSVREEISAIKEIVGDKTLKVILETCYLTDDEKRIACNITEKAGADYVKTSTGFGTGGASIHDVKLMLNAVDGKLKVKASGGIKDAVTAQTYIDLGVSRIGTSSGIVIVTTN